MTMRIGVTLSALVSLAILAVGLSIYVDGGDAPAPVPREPFEQARVVDTAVIRVVVSPGTVGPTDLHLFVEDPQAGLGEPKSATASLAAGDDRIEIPLLDTGRAHWLAEDIMVSRAATWSLRVLVQTADGRDLATTFTIPIGEG